MERSHKVIASTVVRGCRMRGAMDLALMDDLIQDTYLKICADRCRALREFESQHEDALFAFLKTVAYSVVQDHFRASMAVKRGSGRVSSGVEGDVAAGESGADKIERALLVEEIRVRLRGFDARDQRIFWLYFRYGMTSRAISEIPAFGLTSKGVESTLLRMTRQLRTELVERTTTVVEKGKTPPSAFRKGDG